MYLQRIDDRKDVLKNRGVAGEDSKKPSNAKKRTDDRYIPNHAPNRQSRSVNSE